MFKKKVSEKEIHCPANHRKAKLYECKSCAYKGICVVYLEEQNMLIPCQGLLFRNDCEHRGLLIHKKNGHYSVKCNFRIEVRK